MSLERIAAETPALVGAELRNPVNEAALLAGRKEITEVTGLTGLPAQAQKPVLVEASEG